MSLAATGGGEAGGPLLELHGRAAELSMKVDSLEMDLR
jgi:hypothetical protein